ncbi:sugar phosphate isomerase/epimerase [Mucilaginibacter sp. UR6-11]|uniref:sugar phosphate isomerase/epimerase family protein n=1 Tax=Mucilaginibacter sp. UR6-11 TaxID=1435644 RepID=UPI001E5D1A51|nr:sugar phosphate isomerase/epimerase [Mucilaginibacter sp. UR6-11]MCC8424536.1 TIM barrel protein [Mucilaginibacter sp. UR6-11]
MTKRRDFLKSMGALAAGSVLLSSYKLAPKKVTNAGIQLYTFRGEMTADPKGTLKIIADLGIKQVESAASNKGLYYGLTPKEMQQTCKDLGMTLRSGHCGIDANWQKTVDQAAESGQEYLVCSSLPFWGDTVANYQKVAERFNRAGEECKKAGLKFGYHNHDFEFKQENGQVLYDILLKNTDPALVNMEMDLGWVVASGNDPFAYFKNYPGRFSLWHLKDMKGKSSVEFGNGGLDIVGLLKHGKDAGMKYFFIEQEDYPAGSPLASMKLNMDYLKKVNY